MAALFWLAVCKAESRAAKSQETRAERYWQRIEITREATKSDERNATEGFEGMKES